MLNSLVRVSRRVGWVTDLLAANRQSLPRALHQANRDEAASGHELASCDYTTPNSCDASLLATQGGDDEAQPGLFIAPVGERAVLRDG